MNTRHFARQVAFQILYEWEMVDRNPPVDSVGLRSETRIPPHRVAKSHFEHFQVPKRVQAFALELVEGVITSIQTIDPQLETLSTNWKLNRMSAVDRNLLRLGAYEIIEFSDIPPAVTINEMVELAKQFGAEDSAPFINGILDKLAQSRKSA